MKNLTKPLIFLFFLSTYSCAGVQDVVFPSLSDEEVVAPPALEDGPATIESAESPTQEIPPSQYAQPPVGQPQVAYDTGPTGTFVGGKINQFNW